MPSKSRSILIGAAVAAVLAFIQGFLAVGGGTSGQYLGSLLCCLVAAAGAGTAVWHYTTTHNLTIPAGTGAGLGAAAVSAGYLVAYLIGVVLQAVGLRPSNAELLEQGRQQMIDQGMDSALVDQGMGVAEMASGPLGAAITLLVMAVLGAIVGAIAASVFKRGTVEDYEV